MTVQNHAVDVTPVRRVQVAAPPSTPRTWQRTVASAVITSDLALVALCCAVGVAVGEPTAFHTGPFLAVVTAMLIVLGLSLNRAWDGRALGVGATEFRRVYRAAFTAAAVLGFTGLAVQVEAVREWVFVVIPAWAVLSLAARYGLRRVLHAERRRGRCLSPVLAVGSEQAVADLIRRTRRDQHFGWRVDAACTPTGTGDIDGVPVVGDLDAVGRVALETRPEVVAVAPAPGWGPGRLHQLAWQLEGTGAELAVDPGLMEIAGPRLHITPIDGMPLLRLSQPRFSGLAWLLKGAADRLGALALLLVCAPLFVAVGIAVRRDGGPAFHLQERVGANGRPFRMVKFRSMVVDADVRLAALGAAHDGAGPLFKLRDDPRVTHVGRVLRRYSLDELPQLLNVLTGSMSLVGPRPPLAREVAQYGPDARRRLLVRPGMTGLWQVSGRSDLSWEETVRLDLRYVENWSMALDATILWKTLGAVIGSRGAY